MTAARLTKNAAMKFGTILNADVDTLEDVVTIDVANFNTLTLTFVVGVANLDNLDVYGKAHEDGGYALLASVAADYTTPVYPVLKATSDLSTAQFGADVHGLVLDVSGLHSVKIRAAGTSSTITGHFGAK